MPGDEIDALVSLGRVYQQMEAADDSKRRKHTFGSTTRDWLEIQTVYQIELDDHEMLAIGLVCADLGDGDRDELLAMLGIDELLDDIRVDRDRARRARDKYWDERGGT